MDALTVRNTLTKCEMRNAELSPRSRVTALFFLGVGGLGGEAAQWVDGVG